MGWVYSLAWKDKAQACQIWKNNRMLTKQLVTAEPHEDPLPGSARYCRRGDNGSGRYTKRLPCSPFKFFGARKEDRYLPDALSREGGLYQIHC